MGKKILLGFLITVFVVAVNTPALMAEAGNSAKGGKNLEKAVKIETKKGNITFRMYPDSAPNTVARITELVESKFYDGLTFHRVIAGFVIQGGDPRGNGTGGSGQHLKAEFNDRKHVLGTVAMARASDPDSADSQFYICLGPQPHLDGKYTVFGQVVEGMDVLPKIEAGDVMEKVSMVDLPE